MPRPLPDAARTMLDAPTFPTLATVNEDGSPQATPHWVSRDGDAILLSTVKGRRHERNLRRDPRVSVAVVHPEDPYKYLEARGVVTLTEEGGRELIDALAKKYLDLDEYPWDTPDAVRVVIRLEPEHLVVQA